MIFLRRFLSLLVLLLAGAAMTVLFAAACGGEGAPSSRDTSSPSGVRARTSPTPVATPRPTPTPTRALDSDNDGILDHRERQLGTNPLRRDTDRDGMPDGQELRNRSNPLVPDTDRDGVLDGDDLFPLDDASLRVKIESFRVTWGEADPFFGAGHPYFSVTVGSFWQETPVTPLERRRFEDGPELFFELDDSSESVAVVVQAWDDDGTFDRPDAYDISSVAGEFDGSTLSGNPCASLLSKSFDPLDLKGTIYRRW